MRGESLGVVDRKVYGALLMICDSNLVARANHKEIARLIGYKASGGIITYALKMLEVKNFIAPLEKNTYKVLL